MINNLKLEFGEKSLDYLNGEVHRLRVVLKNDDGAYYPIKFPKDYLDKTEAELYLLALEKIYQDNFPNRAENEKFNVIGELIEKTTLTIDKMETQMTKQQEQSSMAQVALMSVIFKFYEKGLLTDEDLAETTITEAEQSHRTITKRKRHDD